MPAAAGPGSAGSERSAPWLLLPRQLRCAVASVVAAAYLSGCLFLPKTTTDFDPKCRIVTRHVELEAQQMGYIGSCGGGDACLGVLVVMGVVSAGSAVVSGSIAVVGNVVYWLEERGRCLKPG